MKRVILSSNRLSESEIVEMNDPNEIKEVIDEIIDKGYYNKGYFYYSNGNALLYGLQNPKTDKSTIHKILLNLDNVEWKDDIGIPYAAYTSNLIKAPNATNKDKLSYLDNVCSQIDWKAIWNIKSYDNVDLGYLTGLKALMELSKAIGSKRTAQLSEALDIVQTAFDASEDSAPAKSKKLNNAVISDILRAKHIDTSIHHYAMHALRYERYGDEEPYTIKFKCRGDWFAYLSMLMHTSPARDRAMNEWFNEAEFEALVNECPTVEAMRAYATQHWWGDGDDYIIYLQNLDTGEYLYGPQEVDY